MATKKEYIIKGFGLQTLKTVGYAAGITATTLSTKRGGTNADYAPGINALPTTKFIGSVPYWAQLSIPAGSYLKVDEAGNETVIPYDGIEILTSLMSVSQPKNIVKTAIQGRNGTVKEYVSDGDYIVNIKGVLTGANSEYPEEDVETLKSILAVPSSIKIVSAWLQQFDITDVVVENYSFPQKEGFYNVQLFEINCLSDVPIEVSISQ